MDVIRGFKIGYKDIRVGVIHYASEVVTDFHLKQYYNSRIMLKKIWKIPHLAGITNTAGGIEVTAFCCTSLRG